MLDPKAPPAGQSKLDRANWVRSRKAELRAGLQSGAIEPVALMRGSNDEWEPVVKRLTVGVVAKAIRGFGPVMVREFLEAVELDSATRLYALTYAKRGEMADLIHYALHGVPPQDADPTSPYAPPAT